MEVKTITPPSGPKAGDLQLEEDKRPQKPHHMEKPSLELWCTHSGSVYF